MASLDEEYMDGNVDQMSDVEQPHETPAAKQPGHPTPQGGVNAADVGSAFNVIMGTMVDGYRRIQGPVVKEFRLTAVNPRDPTRRALYYLNSRKNKVYLQKQHLTNIKQTLKDCSNHSHTRLHECPTKKKEYNDVIVEYEKRWQTRP